MGWAADVGFEQLPNVSVQNPEAALGSPALPFFFWGWERNAAVAAHILYFHYSKLESCIVTAKDTSAALGITR